jgi:hypothetical protein
MATHNTTTTALLEVLETFRPRLGLNSTFSSTAMLPAVALLLLPLLLVPPKMSTRSYHAVAFPDALPAGTAAGGAAANIGITASGIGASAAGAPAPAVLPVVTGMTLPSAQFRAGGGWKFAQRCAAPSSTGTKGRTLASCSAVELQMALMSTGMQLLSMICSNSSTSSSGSSKAKVMCVKQQ